MPPVIRVGVIGWNYPEWAGTIYPERAKPSEFLRHYAERFPIVEAASSYYGMPQTSTVQKWADATPDDFEISLKIPDWILSKDPTDPDLARVLRVFLDHVQPLANAGKLGALVAQYRPSHKREKHADDLAAFVAALPDGPRWAVELRDASWWREETYDTLRDAGVTLVWSALGGEHRTPPVATTRALYLRLFGDRELPAPYGEKRRDATDELALWADWVKDAAPNVERVDVLVSKYLEGYAPASAATIARMLGAPLRERGPARRGLVQSTFG